jgi:hypothetical protein
MIVSVGGSSILGVPLFSFLYPILSSHCTSLFAFELSIFVIFLALIILGDLLNAKLRSKTLQKFTKY